MPNCFTLTRKSDMAAGPVKLNGLDEEICKMMGVPVHPTRYCHDWYGVIGFSLAMGDTFDDIKVAITKGDYAPKEPLLKIADWLDTNFVSNAWYQGK